MSKGPGFFGTTLNVLRTARRWIFSKGDIHVEAAKGNLASVEALLTQNPKLVSLVDKMDYGTPLHWAAMYGQQEVCELLIEYGADVNSVDDLGLSPLRWAVDGSEAGVVRLLLDRGADVNLKDAEGITPLRRALDKKRDEIAALLRDHGAKE
jgi:26S proteasome non-ATPase regulatory subunit 10